MIKRIGAAVIFFLPFVCLGQPVGVDRDPMQKALIWVEDRRQVGQVNSGIVYGGDVSTNPLTYARYVDYIVLNYEMLFGLSQKQQETLRSRISRHRGRGLTSDVMHSLVEGAMRELLGTTQFLRWKSLSSYPEYTYAQSRYDIYK
jgi:hypothetical protein